jgi:hypothetical protein
MNGLHGFPSVGRWQCFDGHGESNGMGRRPLRTVVGMVWVRDVRVLALGAIDHGLASGRSVLHGISEEAQE